METCEQMAAMVVQAQQQKVPVPDFSRRHPQFDLATAYEVQKLCVQQRLQHERIGGFKAGLTSKEAQQHAGFHQPVAGVLYASGRLDGSPVIDHTRFGYLLAEQEFGFEIGKRIAAPLSSLEELRASVRLLRPMVELGDAGYVSSSADTAILDLVAANCGSSHYIAGPGKAPAQVDLARLHLRFTRDAEELSRWEGEKSRSDHWQDALWLVNTVTGQGYVIEPGHILITGGLGSYFHAHPGKYRADFAALGEIAFEVG